MIMTREDAAATTNKEDAEAMSTRPIPTVEAVTTEDDNSNGEDRRSVENVESVETEPTKCTGTGTT